MRRDDVGEQLLNTSYNSAKNNQLTFYFMYLFLYSVHLKIIS